MKIIRILMLISICALLPSCGGSWYTSTLNSRGITPSENSYYISSSDSTITSTLEFKEYAEILKQRLHECGYTETTPKRAKLIILLDYQLGNSYLAATTTNSYSTTNEIAYASINSSTKASSNAYANASIITKPNTTDISINANARKNGKSNTNISTNGTTASYNTTSAVNTYVIPLLVEIKASNKSTNETIWEVVISDVLYRETQMQSVMPWLILSAQPYFGRSSGGEIQTRINNTKDIRERYNLVWPY